MVLSKRIRRAPASVDAASGTTSRQAASWSTRTDDPADRNRQAVQDGEQREQHDEPHSVIEKIGAAHVAAIVVNYRTPELTIACVESLLQYDRRGPRGDRRRQPVSATKARTQLRARFPAESRRSSRSWRATSTTATPAATTPAWSSLAGAARGTRSFSTATRPLTPIAFGCSWTKPKARRIRRSCPR